MSDKKGFTLIELLVVISIISLLSSIVLTTLSEVRTRAQKSAKKQTVLQIEKAIEAYRVDNGSFPSVSGNVCLGVDEGETCWGEAAGVSRDDDLNSALDPYINTRALAEPGGAAGEGFLYRVGGLHIDNCAPSNTTGDFILWVPDLADVPNNAADCPGEEFYSCAGAGIGRFCALQLDE